MIPATRDLVDRVRSAPVIGTALGPFLRPPAVPVSVGFCDGRLVLAELGRLPDGGPFLRAFADAPLEGHRSPASLTQPNLESPARVAEALESLARQTEVELRRCNLVLPDRAARVVLLTLEQFPTRRKEQDELLRWQLRKTTPFSLEEARLDWIHWEEAGAGTRVLAVAVRSEVLGQYEQVLEALDCRPAHVTLESLALASLDPRTDEQRREAGDEGLLHVSEEGFIFLVQRRGRPLFYRCKTWRRPPGDVTEAVRLELVPSLEYYRSRLGGRGLSALRGAGPLAREPGIVACARELIRAGMEPVDPDPLLFVPTDLDVDEEARRRLAPCVAPALEVWNA